MQMQLFILLSIFFFFTQGSPLGTCTTGGNPREVLYVWAGFGWLEKNPAFADHLAVIDFDKTSSTYGTVLSTVPIPSLTVIVQLLPLKVRLRLPSGNEPHHLSISPDGRYLAAGGLLSFLQLSDEIFVWDLLNPLCPQFLFSCDPIGACTDEFTWYQPATGNPGWLVTQMCSGVGSPSLVASGPPGAFVFVDPIARTCRQWSDPTSVNPTTEFNPHGFGVTNDLIAVTDYILPLSLAVPGLPITMRNSVRVFGLDTKQKKFFKVTSANGFPEDAGGFMDTKFIPNDPRKRFMSCGSLSNKIYLIDPETGPQIVFDLSSLNSPPGSSSRSAGIIQFSSDGTRLVMTFAMRYLILFNITDPERLDLLQIFDFCDPSNGLGIDCCRYTENKPGSHYVLLVQDERIVVVNYFLEFIKFQYGGNKKVYAFDLNEDKTSFTVDFNFNPVLEVQETEHVETTVNVAGLGVTLPFTTIVDFNITKKASPHAVQYRKIR